MRSILAVLFVLFTLAVYSQEPGKEKPRKSLLKSTEQKAKEKAKKAPITTYKIFTLSKDTTYVDTSLTIKKEYEYNYLRKDIFGLLPFLNEGHTYTTLDFGLNKFNPYPEMGYKGKHFNYDEADQMKYYDVATPLTDLYFKTVMEQGQSLDALLTLNTSEQFNFSLSYKGVRSLGKYINQLSSNGNFRFTTSYHTKSRRYIINGHFTGQDFLNGENGGITTLEDFEGKNPDFKQRPRLEVYLKDAKSFLKGKRYFINHTFRVNPSNATNNLYVSHQFNYESKFYEYLQPSISSTIGGRTINHFGNTYSTSQVKDQLRYNKMYNKVGAIYENKILGSFRFSLDDFRYNHYYGTVIFLENQPIPSALNDKINNFSAEYEYRKNKWKGQLSYTNSITNQSLTNIEGKLAYRFNPKNEIDFAYQNTNKLPDNVYNLHQSSFVAYNWFNNFKNEKINTIQANANTQWANASLQISNFDNFLYFSDDSANDSIQLISPKQYNKSIQYLSLKVNKEIIKTDTEDELEYLRKEFSAPLDRLKSIADKLCANSNDKKMGYSNFLGDAMATKNLNSAQVDSASVVQAKAIRKLDSLAGKPTPDMLVKKTIVLTDQKTNTKPAITKPDSTITNLKSTTVTDSIATKKNIKELIENK